MRRYAGSTPCLLFGGRVLRLRREPRQLKEHGAGPFLAEQVVKASDERPAAISELLQPNAIIDDDSIIFLPRPPADTRPHTGVDPPGAVNNGVTVLAKSAFFRPVQQNL